MGGLRRAVAVGLAVVLLTAGCRPTAPRASVSAAPARPQWRSAQLPAPPGPPGRLMLRDLTVCAGRWFLVGAVATADGGTRPAAWTSVDAGSWTALPVAGTSFYGRLSVLYAAACRDGRLVALGAKSGGVHGNPRVVGWRLDGFRLVEVPAPFELFGGPEAVDVSRLAGGPAGWLIVGSRTTGAAAWVSADAARFDLLAGAPGLASDDGGRTWAFDAVADGPGWLAVGCLYRPGRIDPDPLAWRSADGRVWRRVAVPTGGGWGQLERVVRSGGAVVAVGRRDDGFGAWRDGGDGWVAAGRFGVVGGAGVSSVRALAAVGGSLLAATSDGSAHTLWTSADEGRTWRSVAGPGVPMPAGGDRGIALAGAGDRVVLAVDDGGRSGLWVTASGALADRPG